jgi:putative flippase GtrA
VTFSQLLRYGATSLGTAAVDNLTFVAFYRLSGSILAAQAAGRLTGMAFQYAVSKRAVFQSAERHGNTAPRYLLLVAFNFALSYGLIRAVVWRFPVSPVWAKLGVESLLFFWSFAAQRWFVFARRAE